MCSGHSWLLVWLLILFFFIVSIILFKWYIKQCKEAERVRKKVEFYQTNYYKLQNFITAHIFPPEEELLHKRWSKFRKERSLEEEKLYK